MEGNVDPRLLARQPQQARSRRRFERILDGARELLMENGLSAFSIPALAERLGFIRATIYQYFPTPYAILNELMQRELGELEALLGAQAPQTRKLEWEEALVHIVTLASEFHNTHPIGRMLILGGPVSDEGHLAQSLTIRHLGSLTRSLLEARGFDLPAEPDVPVLAVDIGTTCFRVSFHLHGTITEAYRQEAVRAMSAYLRLYEPAS